MICIVGSLAVDLLVYRESFRKGTSNPSSMRFAPGGVGYRIYSHLDCPKVLFTALGSDVFGRWLVGSLPQPQWVNPIFLDRYSTACYCALIQSGELLYGAADMAVIERGLSWAHLRARLPELGPRDYLVLEANLAPELVRSLIRNAGTKTRVVFESVSVEKLLRHAENLKNLYLLSGNEDELRALGDWFAARRSGAGAGGAASVRASRSRGWVPEYLARMRIRQFLGTRGRRGVRLWQRGEAGPMEISSGRVIEAADTTGAGDALLSAYLEGLAREEEQQDALRRAVRSVETTIQEGTL
jgi:sugar/nucleoside kinase (ribokinase family)